MPTFIKDNLWVELRNERVKLLSLEGWAAFAAVCKKCF